MLNVNDHFSCEWDKALQKLVFLNHFSSLEKNNQTNLLQMEEQGWGSPGSLNWAIAHCETVMNEWIVASGGSLEGSYRDCSLTVPSMWAFSRKSVSLRSLIPMKPGPFVLLRLAQKTTRLSLLYWAQMDTTLAFIKPSIFNKDMLKILDINRNVFLYFKERKL